MSASLDPGKDARTASGIPIVASYDGFRATAIILIVLYHAALFSGTLVGAGDSAGAVAMYGGMAQLPLTMMFAISGFVLFLPTAARGGVFGRGSAFYVRRFARILPAYWLVLLVAVLVLVVLPEAGDLPSLKDVFLHVFMLQTPALLFDGDTSLGFGVVAAVWTLSIESVFYLLLPLIAGTWFRRPFACLVAAALLLVGWRLLATNLADIGDAFGIDVSDAATQRFDTFYASQFPAWFLAIGSGMTGAWAYVRVRQRFGAALIERRAPLVAAAALAGTLVVAAFAGREAINDEDVLTGLFARESVAVALLMPPFVAATMTAVALSSRRLQGPFTLRPLRAMGDISYSVYLVHLAVLVVMAQELGLSTGASFGFLAIWGSIALAASFGYAYLSSTLLERPIRRWARRATTRPDDPGSVPPSAVAASPAEEAEPPAGPRPVTGLAAPDAAGLAPPDPSLPAVSIVIPTFNRERWLAPALDSVLAQDYGNLEVLVVDDGSADGTAGLLAGYAERWPEHRFRFIRQENAGQAVALNNGNAAARGEILGYLSDDDELLPGAISRLASELIADPQAAIAYPAYREIDEDGLITNTVLPLEYSSRTALRVHDTIIGPGGLARREALERAGGWDPGLRWLGDLILWIGAGLEGKAVRVEEPLALWRRHSGSATVELSPAHAHEHLRCVEIASAMRGIGPLSTEDRAEALRNACIFAALFGGGNAWPGDRFVAFDLLRRRSSAVNSRLGPGGEIDWAEAERATELYRELANVVAPPESTMGVGGLEVARARLAEVGALPESEPPAEPVPAAELTLALVEAAFACGADIEPSRARFLICDRSRASIDDGALDELTRLGFGSSAGQLAEALARRRA